MIIRPSPYAGVIIPALFIDGKYAGDIEATTKLIATVPAGEHVLLLGPLDYTDACRRMNVQVEAGKLYFVEATVANGAILFAMRASDLSRWRPWLEVPSRQIDDLKLAASPFDASSQAECQTKANKRWSDWTPDDRAKASLAPSDGFAVAP